MFCIQCGKQVPDDNTSCPSCGTQMPARQADPVAASIPAAAATVPQKSTNKAIWIVGAVVAILVISYFALTGGSNQKLTTQRVQQTLSQWSNGGIVVTGVQEIPQQNSASAALLFSSFNIRQNGLFGGTTTRAYTGPGEATLTHYTDGRWVLVKVSTSEGFNSTWWDNLNLQVR